MDTGGVLVSVSDEETLNLCLERGIYGQHVTLQEGDSPWYGGHYSTLADHATLRDRNHVFFSHSGKVYYGGQVVGSDDYGAFYVNGRNSLMGRQADAPLVWDESSRDAYAETDNPGVFRTDEGDYWTCQPFLIRFEGEEMVGSYVDRHRFYFELGDYPHLLPSHQRSATDFCTLTPGETETLVTLLEDDCDGRIDVSSDENVELVGEPAPFSPGHGIRRPEDARSVLHLQAAVVSNPLLLPRRFRPDDCIICRAVPISPYKPGPVPRADVCYYSETDPIEDGTLPNTILNIRTDKIGDYAGRQIRKYFLWLYRLLGDDATRIDVFVYAADCLPTFWDEIPDEYESQVEIVTFADR